MRRLFLRQIRQLRTERGAGEERIAGGSNIASVAEQSALNAVDDAIRTLSVAGQTLDLASRGL